MRMGRRKLKVFFFSENAQNIEFRASRLAASLVRGDAFNVLWSVGLLMEGLGKVRECDVPSNIE